jgi:DNA-binding IclR family transcriptional regulator
MIQSVERAAAILRVLGSGTPRLGVTDPDTGKYSLGAGVLQLGNAFLDGSEVRARSLLWAEALAQRANESVWVATLSGSRVIVLHHVFRPDNTVQILEVGAAIPWHACALGHAIVANLPPPEAALAQVRRRGYAVEDQEATVGDAGIAAPIVNRAGATAGSIGLVGPAERLLASAAVAELARAVVESARSVSRDLGAGRGGGSVLSVLS